MPFKPDLESAPKSRFIPDVEVYESPTIGERAGATAYGMATGLAGGLGELEKFGAYKVPEMLGLREEEEPKGKFMGRETIFPTIEEAEKGLGKLGIKKPREEVSGARTLGELLGPSLTAVPRATRTIVGTPSRTGETTARRAEQLGFKISPAQVRSQEPIPMRGATGFGEHNQTLANKLASKGTGVEVDEINREFLQKRFEALGKDFDNLYENQIFNIDQKAVDAITDIANFQNQLPGFAATSSVKQAANKIINDFNRLQRRPGAQPNTFGVQGEALQKLRNALSEYARSSTSRGDAREIYDLIDVIDDSVQRNHSNIAKQLDIIRPQYRNTIILEDLMRQGGIDNGNISLQRLGNMLGPRKESVRRGFMDIDELGRLGKDLRIRAMWEGEGGSSIPLGGTNAMLGRMTGLAGDLGTAALLGIPRGRMARTAQRQLARLPSVGQSYGAPAAMVGGGVAGQFRQQEE